MLDLDEIDIELLDEIDRHPGNTVAEIIRPFLLKRSKSALRYRIAVLEFRGRIRTKRLHARILLYPVNGKGKAPRSISDQEAP